MLGTVFERFVEKSPISVMVRATLERVLGADRLDLWYQRTAQKQYTRELLFSTMYDLMSQVVFWALITASATLHPLSLSQCSSRRTERGWRYLDGSQNGSKHRTGLLPEKSLRCGRAVRTREEKVMHGCQARTLSWMIEPSQLVIAQREVPVAPFHIGAGALKHLRERLGLMLELVLLLRAQRT